MPRTGEQILRTGAQNLRTSNPTDPVSSRPAGALTYVPALMPRVAKKSASGEHGARARAIEREEVWQLEIPRWKYRVGSTALILCFGKMMAAEAATDIVFRVRYQAAAPPADRRD